MRKFAIIGLFVLVALYAKTQSPESDTKVLAVERTGKNHKITHIFKPGKKLIIETKNGFRLPVKVILFSWMPWY